MNWSGWLFQDTQKGCTWRKWATLPKKSHYYAAAKKHFFSNMPNSTDLTFGQEKVRPKGTLYCKTWRWITDILGLWATKTKKIVRIHGKMKIAYLKENYYFTLVYCTVEFDFSVVQCLEGASELSVTISSFTIFPQTNQCWKEKHARGFCGIQG